MVDTNVWISGLLLPGSTSRQALDAARQKGQLLLSFASLAELYEVLSRKQFRRYIDEEDVRRLIAVTVRESQWIEVNAQITICRDPKDNKFLELAVSGRATHIISGDADLLVLDRFRGIRIVSPRAFLDL